MPITTKKYKTGKTLFIAIDGHGGSGKSTLAEMLAKNLKAEVVHTDDFATWDNPLNWWSLVVEYVFNPIRNGKTLLNYPRSKWWETHHPEPVVNQSVTPLMILEGVGSLRKEFRPFIGYGIFVDTPLAVCLQRGFERDKGVDDKSDKEILTLWEQSHKAEEAYIECDQPQVNASLVVDGTKSFEPVVDTIIKKIKGQIAC